MSNLLTKNLPTKLLALVAATVFWFFILSNENTFFAYPESLAIQAFNVPEGLAVVNDLETATVTVRTDQETYKTLSADNFTVYVDLSGLAAGSKTVDVSVNSKKPEVSVVSINPESVEVILEELTTASFPVTLELEGEPAENYGATLINTDDDAFVEVSGAESVLETISEVTAVLPLSGSETSDVSKNVTLVALDANGESIPNVTIEPQTIELTALIHLEQSQKSVGIKVNVEPLENGWIRSVTTDPSLIQIQGEADILEAVQFLETETLTIPEGRTNYQTTITLDLPAGITLGAGESLQIEVSFVIEYDEATEEASD